MPDRDRVQAFVALVEQGQYVEALEGFYHPHASMQDNQQEPRLGRDRLIADERATMARFETMKTDPVTDLLIDGDKVVIRWRFTFTPAQGPAMIMEEVALQRWEGRPHRRGALLLRSAADPSAPGRLNWPDEPTGHDEVAKSWFCSKNFTGLLELGRSRSYIPEASDSAGFVTLRFAAHNSILFPPGRLRPRPETANFQLGRTRVTTSMIKSR